MNNIVVYRYIRLDKDQPFYIGIGTLKRARDTKHGRSEYFKRICNKHGAELEIVENDLDWNTAAEKEKWWIKFYGRENIGTGILCNLTDGGEGAYGRKHTPESIQKGINTKIANGNLQPMLNRTHTIEARAKISAGNIGKVMSAESSRKKSESTKGKPKTRTAKAIAGYENRKHKPNKQSRKIINILTGEIFLCATAAADSTKTISAMELSRKLRGERTNNTPFKYHEN